jgi:hypothetical protein
MKKIVFPFLIAFSLIAFCFVPGNDPDLKDGDIIFQTSQSAQCTAVRLATHSIYSHCGMIYNENGKLMVYEAIGPVKLTPFKDWIKHGKDGKYVVKRLKNAESILSPAILAKMKRSGERFKNKDYDIYFGWNDDLIYCSELVWKIYKEGANIEVGKLKQLKNFDLSSKPVKEKLKERYGDNIPLEETVVAPSDIFESELLETVAEK